MLSNSQLYPRASRERFTRIVIKIAIKNHVAATKESTEEDKSLVLLLHSVSNIGDLNFKVVLLKITNTLIIYLKTTTLVTAVYISFFQLVTKIRSTED